jgi:two-component system nitrate/nitrite response regulator NarL
MLGANAKRAHVYVADDHPVFREAVANAIKLNPEFELVGSAGDGREALDEIRALKPEVAVIDQLMPGLTGVEILRAIQREELPTRTIVVSGEAEGPLVYEAVQLGAAGYLAKRSTIDEICRAVETVAHGGTVLGAEVQHGLVGELRSRNGSTASPLTKREAEVLRHVGDGMSAPQIAEEMWVSVSTVKTHLKNLFAKLDVNDRAAAVAEGMRRGLLE